MLSLTIIMSRVAFVCWCHLVGVLIGLMLVDNMCVYRHVSSCDGWYLQLVVAFHRHRRGVDGVGSRLSLGHHRCCRGHDVGIKSDKGCCCRVGGGSSI